MKVIKKFISDVILPDWDVFIITIFGLNKFSSTLGPNLPLTSFNTMNKCDSKLSLRDIISCIVNMNGLLMLKIAWHAVLSLFLG